MSSESTIPAIRREQAEEQSMLSLLDRAARDPTVDVEKMERILAMVERMKEREAENLYDQAMSAAQSEVRPISRDCHNPQTRSKYASYEAIDSAIRPIYTAHGFAMSFGSKASANGDRVLVTCRVSHRGGHKEYQEVEMPCDGKGAKGGDVMTKTHAVGSALSYGKRYLVNLIWNLSFGEAEDDGNAASGRKRPQERPERQTAPRQPKEEKTPEKPVSGPKTASSADVLPRRATDIRRRGVLDFLRKTFSDPELLAFARERKFVAEADELDSWTLDAIPVSNPDLNILVAEIGNWLEPEGAGTAQDEDFSEAWWDVTITVPRAGMKRADYMVNPDTVRSLYEATKAGDESAKRRLFGLAKEWEPREWEGRDGNMHPPSREDVECREALDAFLESRAAKASELHNFEQSDVPTP